MALSFAPHLEVLPIEGRGLVALGERGCDVYSGPVFAKLASLIDGSRAEADILDGCGNADRGAAADAIAQLRRAGLLVERRDGFPADDHAAWWSSQLISPEAAAAAIRDLTVEVRALGSIDAGPTIKALTDSGLRLDAGGELTIVLVDDYLEPRLAELNEEALRANRRWMLARPQAAEVLVGPVFSPDRGPCWECLASRLREKQGVARRLRAATGAAAGPGQRVGALPSQAGLGPALVATEALRWIAGASPDLESAVLSFDTRGWQAATHRVPWRPQCPVCGEAEASLHRHASPLQIKRRTSRPGGGLRAVRPGVTLERFEHHVSPVTGALDALTRLRGPEHLHVYAASDRNVRINGDRRGWEFVSGSQSSGKGTTDELARASALGEALERYSGCFSGNEPRHRATFAELGDSAVAPNEYMRFSERQFEHRDRSNHEAESFRTYVPEPFDVETPIDWSPVWSLTQERERWVPTALCYYGAEVPGQRFCVAESNGNAAGNTVEEAILHGLLELVERDHVALWWYNRSPAPGVELDSIDDPWLAGFRDHMAAQGLELWALDLTADLEVSAAACLAVRPDGHGIGMGFGSHLDLRSAVVRAGTELAQLGLGGASGGLGAMDSSLRIDEHAFARPDPRVPARTCSGQFTGDVIDALEHCRGEVERLGMELLVLDQTRPDIGLPVVKALVPGLRHFWPRFGPGRLYEVPVSLGWLERPREEDDLNPTPPVR